MDVQDHKTITSSEHEIHGVHLCHKCGWPFPNPHPSAKHRRAHKRVCGTVEGYKLVDSGSDHANLAGSDNEHPSDDERQSPSPNVDKGITKESGASGGMGLKSNRSEDELFSDAATDFSDIGVSPRFGEGSESVYKLDKNVGGQFVHVLEDNDVSKDEKTADTSDPLYGLTQLRQGSTKSSEMVDSDGMRSERNQSEISKSTGDIKNENVSVGVSSISCVNSSQVITEVIVVSDDSTMDNEIGKQNDLISSGVETHIEEENGEEAVDVQSTIASEVLQSKHQLEIDPKLEDIEGKTLGPVVQEATALETDKETLDPHVESDSRSKLSNLNGEASHAEVLDGIVNQEKVLTNDLQCKHDVFHQTKPPKLQDTSLVSEVESDSSKNLFCSSPGQLEVCDLKEAGHQSSHLLSTAKRLPAEENPMAMIGDFKDDEALKSGAPENIQNALSDVPAGSVDSSCYDALDGNLEKQGVSSLMVRAVGTSVPENLPRSISSVPTGTVDDLKEGGVSTHIDGEFGPFPDIPFEHSSVPAQTIVDFSSEKVPEPTNLQNALLNIQIGSLDNCSSEASGGDLEKEGASIPIDGEVGIAVPENLPSVTAGTIDNSSSDALENDPKKGCISTPIGGEAGTSVSENLESPLSSFLDDSSTDAFKDDLKKEGFSTPILGEVMPSLPALANIDSRVSAETVGNSSSEALEDELKKKGVPKPIDGNVSTSAPGNLPSDLSSFPAETVDNNFSEPLEDELKKEVVSIPSDEEVGASVSENLQSALANVPVGSADNTSSEALDDDPEKEGLSATSDGKVGTSVSAKFPSVLSSVPAGITDNSSKEASEDDLKKEGVSTPTNMVAGSSGYRVTSDEDTHLLSVAGTLPAVENPETMIENFKDYQMLPLDVGATEEIKSMEDDEKVSMPGNPGILLNVPAGSIDNSSSDTLEDDLKKDGVAIPIDGEVGASGFMFTSDEDNHFLSVADTSPGLENPDIMTGEIKDYKVLKSHLPLELGAAEEIRSLENDKVVFVPEDLPSALSYDLTGCIDKSSSDALEGDLKKEGVSIPIDGEIGASEFRVTDNADFGSSSSGDHPKISVSEKNISELNNNDEESLSQSVDGKSLKNGDSESPTAREQSDVIPFQSSTGEQTLHLQTANMCGTENADNHGIDKLECFASENGNIQAGNEPSASITTTVTHVDTIPETMQKPVLLAGGQSLGLENCTTKEQSDVVIPLDSSTGDQTLQATNLCGTENADNHGIDKLVCVATENRSIQAGDEPSASVTATVKHVVAIPETIEKPILLAGDQSFGFENSSMGSLSIAGSETVEVAVEEELVKQTHFVHESKQQLINSASSGSNQVVNIDVMDSGKLCNSSESPKYSHEIPHSSSRGHKMGEEREISMSPGAPAVVSDMKYLSSEKTSQNTSSKEVTAFSIEDTNIRDPTILGLLLEDSKNKVIEPNFSVLAVDSSVVSSSRNDSLDGNWGSVSDVTVAVDTEALSSTDTHAAETLDDDAFKKPQGVATECHPDKSDVFEPPSFMTLVESGVGVDKNTTTSEIQTAKRGEQSKSDALQAGWFPLITNVVNESEGRKKNEEAIAKVTNWSTGKQHSPLKSLLNEAQAETKVKSPNTKQVPAVNQADETALKNNGTAVTTVSSILGSEMSSADTVKKEIEKEWNSPARYPIQIKKEKRKGKPYWVPFVCCTSVHQDV